MSQQPAAPQSATSTPHTIRPHLDLFNNVNHNDVSMNICRSPTTIQSPLSAVSHSFRPPQSPIYPHHQSMSTVPFASPSVPFSNLSLRTPVRTPLRTLPALPASLPPTPNLASASPQHTTVALAVSSPTEPSPHSPAPTNRNLQMSYKKMLRRGSNSARRTEMPPPPNPAPMSMPVPVLAPNAMDTGARQDDFWMDVNSFLNDVGNGTPPMIDSSSPVVGSLGTGATPLGGQEWTNIDMMRYIVADPHSNPTSPIIQGPLHPTTPHNVALPFSPIIGQVEDSVAYFGLSGSTASSAQQSDLIASPFNPQHHVQPSPHIQMFTDLDMAPLFPDPEPAPFAKAPPSPYMNLSMGATGPTTSQESNISSTSAPTNSSAQLLTPASVSPSSSKRPRLDPAGSSSRGRCVSSGSSSAPSPFIGASTRPTGYRRNITTGDLVPLAAPTQKRNYVFQSATSRKDLPPSVTKSFHPPPSPRGEKRTWGEAGLPADGERAGSSASEERDAEDAGNTSDEKKALRDHVEAKRRANTIAARKSRRRKVEFIQGLEHDLDALRAENDRLQQENRSLKERAEHAEMQLRQLQPYLG